MKKTYRQSKNVEDFRDTVTGPKKVVGKTRRVQAENTKGKLADIVQNNSSQTENKSLKGVSPPAATLGLNRFSNMRKTLNPKGMGLFVKNKKLDAPPTTFVKVKKKKV